MTAELLESRLRSILPEEYQDRYEDVQPVSMGSAGLTYGPDGRVAWNEIWATFCDLAMAGGPPHRGTLLEPEPAETTADFVRDRQTVNEICRGITLATGLPAEPSPVPGWVRVTCTSWGMAEWLVRAIAMENVSVQCRHGGTIDLPAGADYRVEKEIKNVITAVAKACHYWTGHMPARQRRAVAYLFPRMTMDSPFVQAGVPEAGAGMDRHRALRSAMAATIGQKTELQISDHGYTGWLGVRCADVRSAIWMMRMMIAGNLLSRRERTVVFLPVNPESDPAGDWSVGVFLRVFEFAKARNIVRSGES